MHISAAFIHRPVCGLEKGKGERRWERGKKLVGEGGEEVWKEVDEGWGGMRVGLRSDGARLAHGPFARVTGFELRRQRNDKKERRKHPSHCYTCSISYRPVITGVEPPLYCIVLYCIVLYLFAQNHIDNFHVKNEI